MKYRREIDGLRAIAVMPVLFSHAGFSIFSGGFVGVDVFFVISGFLICGILIDEMQTDKFSFASFYYRRARRILPASLAVIVATYVFAWLWMDFVQFQEFSSSALASVTFLSNIYFEHTSNYFAQDSKVLPLLHFWSLSVEEQFYFFTPILLLTSLRFGTPGILIFISIFTLASFSLNLVFIKSAPQFVYFSLLTRAWELGLGALSAFLLIKKPDLRESSLVAFLGLILILVAILRFSDDTPFPNYQALLPTLGTVLILLFARSENLAVKIIGNRVFVGIGLISYSLYLVHQPIFAFMRIRMFDDPNIYQYQIGICVAFGLAFLSYKFIEKPIRQNAWGVRKLFRNSLVAIITVAGISSLGAYHIIKPAIKLDKPTMAVLDQISLAKKSRTNTIGYERCHFARNITGTSVDIFLQNWDCNSQHMTNWNGLELQSANILVVGDSHAADIASSFRLNGLAIDQLTGAGCPIIKSIIRNGGQDCNAILKFAEKQATQNPYDFILLTNHFNSVSETPKIPEAIKFWEALGASVVVLGSRPIFPDFHKRLVYSSRWGGDGTPVPDFAKADATDSLSKVLNENEVYISSKDIFCSIADCDYQNKNGELLFVDNGHFSEIGARDFGKELIRRLCEVQNFNFCSHAPLP